MNRVSEQDETALKNAHNTRQLPCITDISPGSPTIIEPKYWSLRLVTLRPELSLSLPFSEDTP